MRDLQSHDSSSGDQLTAARASGLGLDPGAVVDLIDDIEAAGLDPHSLMVLRGGRVAVAGWWHPYGPQTRQLVYSLSKSFTATAVGIAIGEGRFGLDDPISTVLGSAPGPLAEGAQRILVRHLLAMASGHGSDTITAMLSTGDALACAGRAGLESDSQQVVAAVLAEPLAAEPGELFTYNQGCSYLLSAAIRHTTGLQLSEYLRPRLFDPLGIGPVHWRRFCGLEQGFSGLHVRTSDIAALGQLYLQQGRWAGRRLVPAGFVAEASAVHVPTAQRQSDPDWQQGYGFHFWQCRFGAFRGDGAFGQFCIVIPDADLVVVTTAQTVRMPDLAEAIWRHLLPGLDRAPSISDEVLLRRLAALRLPAAPLTGEPGEDLAGGRSFAVVGRAWRLQAEWIHLEAQGEGWRVTVDDLPPIVVRPDTWTAGELAIGRGLLPSVRVRGGWRDPSTFDLDVVFINSPHRLTVTMRLPGGSRQDGTAALRWWADPL
jgi:CubicO group peptidase (beta-lactamase class C family)